MMQRLIALLVGLVVVNAAKGQPAEYYINNTSTTATTPIDALNVINNGTLFVAGSGIFNTYSTLNYTNTGSIIGGHLRFETVPPQLGVASPAVNFINSSPNAVVSGSKIEVYATNIVNRGSLNSSSKGRITLKGDTVDLSLSRLTNATPAGIVDNYWGIGEVNPGGFYDVIGAVTPTHEVEFVFPGFGYAPGNMTVGVFAPQIFARTNEVHANTSDVQVVFFLPPEDTTIAAEVKFLGGGRFARVGVQWSNVLQHAESQIYTTNLLYFVDRLATMDLSRDPLVVMPRLTGTPTDPYPTYIPTNYNLTTSFQWGTDPAEVDLSFNPPPPFAPIVEVDDMLYTSWSATLRGNTVLTITNTSPGASVTNVAGRVEVIADKSLNLTRTRITAENYLLLRSTNHFVGSPRSYLSAPTYDLDFGSTNRILTLDGVIPDELGRYTGDVTAWSGLWSYTVKDGDTDYHTNFHIVIIDSSTLAPSAPSTVHDLKVRVPELVLGDIFNIEQGLSLDCESLTITNEGQLNIIGQHLVWSDSLHNLRNLTNFGFLSGDSLILSRDSQPNVPFGTPYDSIVNHGSIFAGGLVIDAHAVINSGFLQAYSGSVNVRFGTGIFTNDLETGIFSSDGISLNGQSLICGNLSMGAQDKITINVTGAILDGGVTGNNLWQSENGFALPVKPASGDLMGTLLWSVAQPWSQVEIRWAGIDRGPNSSGFENNAAVGELWLDGGVGSQFKFSAAEGQNAIYVEDLVLSSDLEADLLAGFFDSLAVDSNFTVYFRNLWTLIHLEDGGVDIDFSSFDPSEFESKTGGQVRWMGAGRAPVNLRDAQGNIIGTIEVDVALRNSSSVDSDGDGTVNATDEFPFDGPVLQTQITESGTVQLQWNAAANTTYSLWSTHNFTTWQKITEVTSGSSAGLLGVEVPALTNACTYKVSYAP